MVSSPIAALIQVHTFFTLILCMCALFHFHYPAYRMHILCMCTFLLSRNLAYCIHILCMYARLFSRNLAYYMHIPCMCTLLFSHDLAYFMHILCMYARLFSRNLACTCTNNGQIREVYSRSITLEGGINHAAQIRSAKRVI